MTYHKDAYALLRKCVLGAEEDAVHTAGQEAAFESRLAATISTLRHYDHVPATRPPRDSLTDMARAMAADSKLSCLDWARRELMAHGSL